MSQTYRAVELKSGRYHVVNNTTNQPLYDDAPFGNDKPRVFSEDAAMNCVSELNNPTKHCPECNDLMNHDNTLDKGPGRWICESCTHQEWDES